MNKKTPVLVLGTTPYTSVMMDMFACLEDIEFVGCVENLDKDRCSDTCMGLPIHWNDDINELAVSHVLTCSLGTTLRRSWIQEKKQHGFSFQQLLHPSSVISRKTELGDGVIIDAGCVVAGFSTIKDHIRIGRRVSIGHHTTIGAYSTIHPGAIVNGNCHVGEQVTIGSGAVLIDGISVGAGAYIAAGTVVTKDVPEAVLAVGNPARIAREEYGPK